MSKMALGHQFTPGNKPILVTIVNHTWIIKQHRTAEINIRCQRATPNGYQQNAGPWYVQAEGTSANQPEASRSASAERQKQAKMNIL